MAAVDGLFPSFEIELNPLRALFELRELLMLTLSDGREVRDGPARVV